MLKKTVQLSREKIASTALTLADREGFQAVSMRRVAEELGVGTMSLYYYVRTKDELVAAMDDALMGEAVLSSLPKGWKRAITKIAERTLALFIRHPWALVSMQTAPPGLNAMRHMEQCLEALAETSMTKKQKMTLLAMVDDLVFGHAVRQSSNHADVDATFATRQMASGAFPRLVEMFGEGRVEAKKDRFEAALRLILDGFESE